MGIGSKLINEKSFTVCTNSSAFRSLATIEILENPKLAQATAPSQSFPSTIKTALFLCSLDKLKKYLKFSSEKVKTDKE